MVKSIIMDKFDLIKYLTENKLTNSNKLKEVQESKPWAVAYLEGKFNTNGIMFEEYIIYQWDEEYEEYTEYGDPIVGFDDQQDMEVIMDLDSDDFMNRSHEDAEVVSTFDSYEEARKHQEELTKGWEYKLD